jgi:hypothetical protein
VEELEMRLWVEATSCLVALAALSVLNADWAGAVLFGGGVAFQCLCLVISHKLFPK